ncbi:hypothetical protein J5N97_024079 [Dioscorea zingiberensis]|uniref:Uncharacterized protein n=1 Tax=Dioscorea zingiberensis TaxID=325984 RepID=A0A9D5C5W4_9LILI|nr:hypothetical protein J5N97_024079 [Dioscorea zingiberensis]
MEKLPSIYRVEEVEEEEEEEDDHHHNQQQHGFFSCWGKLKHVFPWRRLRRNVRRRRRRVSVKRGSFKYDPLSYSQNFDDGGKDEDEENSSRGFSSRFVVPRQGGGV